MPDVAPGEQAAGTVWSGCGRTWHSTDPFASGEHPGRVSPGPDRPDADSGVLFVGDDFAGGGSSRERGPRGGFATSVVAGPGSALGLGCPEG
jgi:hypothetical protein